MSCLSAYFVNNFLSVYLVNICLPVLLAVYVFLSVCLPILFRPQPDLIDPDVGAVILEKVRRQLNRSSF